MAEIRRINIDEIKDGPIRHESLPKELLERIGTIYTMVGRYVSDTLEEFEIGFMRDMHPEREVAVWSRIALAWKKYHEKYLGRKMQPTQQESNIVGLLIAISMGEDKEHMIADGGDIPKDFTNDQWDNLYKCYMNPLDEPGIPEGHHKMS